MSHGSSTSNILLDCGSLDYHPELEWPGTDELPKYISTVPDPQLLPKPGRQHYPVAHSSSFLRLVVLYSSTLPCKTVALIDSFEEVSIGRDRCATPRLRLKELAVSKYHANIYWDSRTQHWSLVDVGSTHGTHLISPDPSVTRISDPIGSQGYTMTELTRLAPPKSASLPNILSHLQRIVIGNTTLVVHIHEDRIPCDACTITQENILDLDASTRPKTNTSKIAGGINPAESMRSLKRNILSQPLYSRHDARSGNHSETYVDRAELRRQRFPGWREPQPRREPVVSQQTSSRPRLRKHSPHIVQAVGTLREVPKLETSSPIPLDNVGHKLLAKQGWKPGLALGSDTKTGQVRSGLLEPLAPQSTTNRRGLGMHHT
ncbi:Forkhead associated domain, partial [Rhizoctonia solani]